MGSEYHKFPSFIIQFNISQFSTYARWITTSLQLMKFRIVNIAGKKSNSVKYSSQSNKTMLFCILLNLSSFK